MEINLTSPARSMLEQLAYSFELSEEEVIDQMLAARLALMIKQERRVDYATFPEFSRLRGKLLRGWDLVWYLADGKEPEAKEGENDSR